MAGQAASQAEVWDDTALLDSWNETFEEYKKYHSLAVKGEKVKVSTLQPALSSTNGADTSAQPTEQEPSTNAPTGDDNATSARSDLYPSATSGPQPTSSSAALPQVMLDNGHFRHVDTAILLHTDAQSVHNEDMKNLMMSWYYAGYYTGLYEGKQQGYANAMQMPQR